MSGKSDEEAWITFATPSIMAEKSRKKMQLNLQRNAIWALVEAISSSIVLFFLYKLVVSFLGVEALGIWSLVLATTSLMRLADAGAASGLGRFVAKSAELQDRSISRGYIDTAVLTNLVLYILLALAFFWPAQYGLSFAIHKQSALEVARGLLPYALASFVLGNLANAASSALAGLQRSDLRSIVTIGGLVVQIVSSFILIPDRGLTGLAIAQLLQNGFGLVSSLILAHFVLYRRYGIIFPFHWRKHAFKDLVGFGIQLQFSGIISFLYDPLAKFLMSSFAGLEATGLFEMANRLVFQVRSLLISPVHILVPAFALLNERDPEEANILYRRSFAMTAGIGIPLIAGVAATSPLVSFVLLAKVDFLFVVFVSLLSCGWLVNLLAAPAYLLGEGTGNVRWNIAGNLVIISVSLVFGIIMGRAFGGIGVAAAAVGAQILGSSLTLIMNCRSRAVNTLVSFQEIKFELISRFMKRAGH
jgi:O-antigen/teichoic acid export membrane protein